MNNKLKVLITGIAIMALGCKHNIAVTISPDAGTSFKTGDVVSVKAHYAGDLQPDSIVYLLDSVKVGLQKDSSALALKTDSMPVGLRIITAKIYKDGKSAEASTNIILFPAKAPDEYTYKVIRTYPHDTSSYTEGLLYYDGYLYESTGNQGHSTLRKVDLETGKAVMVAKLDPKYFGEGSAIIGDKIVMLTYHEKVGFVFDKITFKLLSTFTNNVGIEGWGVTFDGKKLYMDDSSNRIWFLDKDNYHPTGYIDVYDNKKQVDSVNELEYVDGKLYSNVYQHDTILMINPKTGAVLQRIDMKNLWPISKRPDNFDDEENVLNGIAWDEKGKRLFVTGKKWPYVYQVEFMKK